MKWVADTLYRLGGRRGRLGNAHGGEFISGDLDLWAYANNVTLDFSRPGTPTDNGLIEAFNRKPSAELL